MLKRTLTFLTLILTAVLVIAPLPQAQAILLSADEIASLETTSLANASANDTGARKGNGFVRALKAPFKAIGRLFGGKKKVAKIERTSPDDLKDFQTTPRQTTKDSTIAAPLETTTSAVPFSVAENHVEQGRSLLNSGAINEAIAELSRATSLEPKHAEANNLLGVAYGQKNLNERAEKSFEAALRVEKNHPHYLNNYGYFLYKIGELEKATKILKRATKADPQNANIWNNLALVQCEREKFNDAFDSFVRASGEFSARLNISSQLSKHGYAKEAIAHLEKAQAIRPNSTEVLARLVNLYAMTGRVADADTARRSLLALQTFAEANK